jgi:RND family efflux transporter MFP subunit
MTSSVQNRYQSHIKAMERVKVPRAERVLAFLLIFLILLAAAVLWYTPWIQTAQGDGVVNALRPEQRTQAISALVPGQIQTWHVREGDKVKAGDPIVTLVDTDENLLNRLQAQIDALEQQLEANRTALETERLNLQRRRNLLEQGLVSQRDVELVEITLENLRATIASNEAELTQMRVGLARQSLQTKKAPTDGTILRLLSAGNSTFVNAGDVLASFIPDGVERAASIMVSGLDAPLVYPGRKVRLQFEGWPVFQFSGWPSAAVGTFGGIVDFVEPIANQQGQFRVWIREDPDDAVDWPGQQFVRLGSRVTGWVLLNEVKLGYELWRQLNNFPPVNNLPPNASNEA